MSHQILFNFLLHFIQLKKIVHTILLFKKIGIFYQKNYKPHLHIIQQN